MDESIVAQASDGEDATHLTRWVAEEEAAALARGQPVSLDDRRYPGGVDEVALVEENEDVELLRDGGIEPLLKPVGDGEVEFALHSQLATFGTDVFLGDPEFTHLLPPQWRASPEENPGGRIPFGTRFVEHGRDFDALTWNLQVDLLAIGGPQSQHVAGLLVSGEA